MLQSFPFQMWQRYPEIQWHNQGIGGMLIGPSTNYTGQTMFDLDGNFVDPLYDPSLQENWLLFYGGINDINSDGIGGVATFGRLTNYVAARKAAHPWRVVVGTITPSIQDQVHKAEYNDCIRTNAGGWSSFVDPGYNSPVESRLNNYTDPNYFDPDELHLNNNGYSVLADHFSAIVNVPHRTTGVFGP
jgi:lysophospholipase L1-like esterase